MKWVVSYKTWGYIILNLEENKKLSRKVKLTINFVTIIDILICMVSFNKGILICNLSLKNVFLDLQKYHGLDYKLTRKLNQDVLEHLFSFLKGMGGSASGNMTALDFKYWY